MLNGQNVLRSGRQDTKVAESPERFRIPAADIYETPDAYVLMLDIPGAAKETISLKLDKGELRVQAVLEERGLREGRTIFKELSPASFARSFAIGEGIDTDAIDARFEHGVLTVKLFKSASLKPKDIHIN